MILNEYRIIWILQYDFFAANYGLMDLVISFYNQFVNSLDLKIDGIEFWIQICE